MSLYTVQWWFTTVPEDVQDYGEVVATRAEADALAEELFARNALANDPDDKVRITVRINEYEKPNNIIIEER